MANSLLEKLRRVPDEDLDEIEEGPIGVQERMEATKPLRAKRTRKPPLDNFIDYFSEEKQDPLERRDQVSNTRALIAGATPLLMGFLGGGVGDALDIASQGLLQEDKRKLEEDQDLMSYLRKRESARSKVEDDEDDEDKVLSKVWDPKTKRNILVPRSKAAGLEAARTGVGFQTVTDPETGELKTIYRADPSRQKQVFKPTDLTPKQRDRATKAVEKFETLSKKQRDGLDAAEQFMSAISIGNPVSDQFAIFALAKTADSGGRLSDQDVQRFGGSKALGAKMRQIAKDAKDGTLTDENRNFMKEIAGAMIATNKKQLDRKARSFSRRRHKLVGIEESKLFEFISPRPYITEEQRKRKEELRKKRGK